MIFGIFIVLRKVAQWQSQIFPNIIWGPSVKKEEGEGWGAVWKCVRINYNVDSPDLISSDKEWGKWALQSLPFRSTT